MYDTRWQKWRAYYTREEMEPSNFAQPTISAVINQPVMDAAKIRNPLSPTRRLHRWMTINRQRPA
uniref:Uncharacterized protein n=1 Tax=Arundo donax TaxID=35708 RepID=A0A0A8ZJU5_ARUDO